MERQPVSSSNIKSIGHDPKTKDMEVEFKDGSVYTYHGVEADAHQDFVGAKSLGAHFHNHIKSNHKFSKA